MVKKLAIGCGIAAALGVIAVIAVIAVNAPKMFQWAQKEIQEQIAQEQERQQLAEKWHPPAKDAGPEKLFPAKVNDARLASQDEQAAIPEFNFDVKGRHAVYRVGSHDVEVFVYQVTELEKEALFRRVEDAYREGSDFYREGSDFPPGRGRLQDGEGGGGFRVWTNMGYRCYYYSAEHHQNHLWFMKGWLFVFRTRATEDQEPFVKAYLKAVSAEQPAGVKPN